MYTYICTHTYIHIHVYIYLSINFFSYLSIDISIHRSIDISIYLYIYIYMYMYTYIYVCILHMYRHLHGEAGGACRCSDRCCLQSFASSTGNIVRRRACASLCGPRINRKQTITLNWHVYLLNWLIWLNGSCFCYWVHNVVVNVENLGILGAFRGVLHSHTLVFCARQRTDERFGALRCNLNLKIVSPGNRTRCA